jgi:uncharacterized membrane protein (DUF485 family)
LTEKNGGNDVARNLDFQAIAELDSFKKLQRARTVFTLPVTFVFFAFYFGLPILAGFTKVLTHPAIGPISWAWVYAFAQFVVTWTLCMVYLSKAKAFDAINDGVLADVDALPLLEPGASADDIR